MDGDRVTRSSLGLLPAGPGRATQAKPERRHQIHPAQSGRELQVDGRAVVPGVI